MIVFKFTVFEQDNLASSCSGDGQKFGEFNYKSFQRGSAIRSADLSDPSIVICELNLFPRLQIASKQAEIMRRKMGK